MQSYVTNESVTRMKDETLIKLFKTTEAWSCLDAATQRELYNLLPRTSESAMIDTNISPLQHEPYAQHLKAFLAHVEEHLETGAGKRAWRLEAAEATRKRALGKYDAVVEQYDVEAQVVNSSDATIDTGDRAKSTLPEPDQSEANPTS